MGVVLHLTASDRMGFESPSLVQRQAEVHLSLQQNESPSDLGLRAL